MGEYLPTAQLRYVERDFSDFKSASALIGGIFPITKLKILQQLYFEPDSGKQEWRDVETVTE